MSVKIELNRQSLRLPGHESRAGASPAPTKESNQGKIKKVTLGKIWQRNYYEHIVRTQESFDTITAYILTNPQNWTKDKFYIKFQ